MLMGMGLVGWVASLMVGFLVGGVFFLSIKAQVDYVVRKQGATWLMPALMYARMAFVAVVLILTAILVPSEKLAGAILGAMVGVVVARVLVSRMVRRRRQDEEDADGGE